MKSKCKIWFDKDGKEITEQVFNEFEKDWLGQVEKDILAKRYFPKEICDKILEVTPINGDWPLSNKLRYEDSDIWGVE